MARAPQPLRLPDDELEQNWPGEGGAAGEAIDAYVRLHPNQDFNYDDVTRSSEDPLPLEPLKSRLTRLAQKGFLKTAGRKKVPGKAQAKDRTVIHYRATAAYLRRLDMIQDEAVQATNARTMLVGVHSYAAAHGFVVSVADVANFFLCLQAKPFVILSGISGTGKSKLPRLVADAIGASYRLIPVKPNWSDNSDLMGYYSVASRRFRSGQLLDAIGDARKEPNRPHIVVLDEMNLAHVEHYLSDLLSIMETRRRDAGGSVVSDALPLDIPNDASEAGALPEAIGSDLAAGERGVQRDERLDWDLPWNLLLIGTVNVDETTHPFSRKVLDRSYAIDQEAVDLMQFGTVAGGAVESVLGAHVLLLDRPLAISEVFGKDPVFFEDIARELVELNDMLRPAGLHFAYRVRDEISLYMWAWRRHDLASLLSRDQAFDLCILQKVLPRCQGSSETAARALKGILAHAEVRQAEPLPMKDEDETLAASDGSDPGGGDLEGGENKGIQDGGLEGGATRGSERSAGPGGNTEGDRYPRTARKARAMLVRYGDTGYFAFWS